MESKRMMSDKQDQYREYVVNKLLVNTHIEYSKNDEFLYINITIRFPHLKYQMDLVHKPVFGIKDALPMTKPFRKYPMEFRGEMKQYSIYDDEVQLMWDTYSGMLGKMVDVDYCREVCGSVDVAKIWREGNVETEMY
jgi:hypothetical protein